MPNDPDFEFGVTLGQAFNLAMSGKDTMPTKEEIYEVFYTLLETKLDPEFRSTFKAYLNKKLPKYEKSLPVVHLD